MRIDVADADAQLAQAAQLSATLGDYMVAVLDDPQYATGLAFGLKGDTGITVLEGEAA